MASMLPAEATQTLQWSIEPRVILFAAALTIGTGLLFGLFPALHRTRPDLLSTLKGQAGQPSGARAASRFRTSLATAQIALSMALLVSAGLFTKSLFNVSRVDLGLKADNVVTFGIAPELNGYLPERSKALFERLEDELAAHARRHRRHGGAGGRARRQQLGQQRVRRGIQVGARPRYRVALQRNRARVLQHARDSAHRRTRVHRAPTARQDRSSRSSTRRSRRSSTSVETSWASG